MSAGADDVFHHLLYLSFQFWCYCSKLYVLGMLAIAFYFQAHGIGIVCIVQVQHTVFVCKLYAEQYKMCIRDR